MMGGRKLYVIGGGAGGFFSAILAKEHDPGREVTILEKTGNVLQKVKVSGGGRCNLTHGVDSIGKLLENYPRGKNFLKKVFYAFGVEETRSWFEKNGLALKTEEDGRVFPVSNSSQSVIDLFLSKSREYGIRIIYKQELIRLSYENHRWKLFSRDQSYESDDVIIACGGFHKKQPYDFLEELGHHIIPPCPSLFTFNVSGNEKLKELMGVSVPFVHLRIPKLKARSEGPLLITHWGISGPAVLKLSAWQARTLHALHYEFDVFISWIAMSEAELRDQWNRIRNNMLGNPIHKNPFGLPRRLWNYICTSSGINERERWSELRSDTQNKLIRMLTNFSLPVKGKTTFKEEFVTCGGISLQEVNPHTMESRIHEHLFFTGEVLDIDGITGGFNFQNCWSTAALAARLGQ